jgi:hypothetical protein
MRLKMLALVLVALACSAGVAFAQGSTAASVAPKGAKPPKPAKEDKGAGANTAPTAQGTDAAPTDKAAQKDAKNAAKDTAKATKGAAKDTAKTTKDVARVTAKATKAQTKAAAKAAKAAAKELKFKTEMRQLGYSCRGGTTHVVGRVVSVTPGTPAVPATPTTPATPATPGSMVVEVIKGNSRGSELIGTPLTVTIAASTEVERKGTGGVAGTLPVGAIVKLDLRLCTPTNTTTTGGVAPTSVLVARKISSRA